MHLHPFVHSLINGKDILTVTQTHMHAFKESSRQLYATDQWSHHDNGERFPVMHVATLWVDETSTSGFSCQIKFHAQPRETLLPSSPGNGQVFKKTNFIWEPNHSLLSFLLCMCLYVEEARSVWNDSVEQPWKIPERLSWWWQQRWME